uniref:ADP,ATP carrier protein n=1 Tax=Aplanochytrium stocchinoi TaxID=215587 RepID=A0A7S3LQ80_9STRA|mmetsp:Transcript_8909/g.11203  ORF Transcript_8909/g.11203 Transcript_8909/m.11203 type:complete len:248 (-) Transcript_8909:228-971(-)|eukprot:CAMPEP_0204848786 /NCGR_PEP_ID=MMETSP1347-20130617/5041_1 /ASSEMBLY_ACC=CAM_ASM_000690 /TAXON_ID=215587 /ORGANISM="Aplanochytrium stocchinoi, Strain GSBS06" /LENGTH=247 /DNA_ID=CAMNT_0051990663 /DNA_START=30 /DNA_END=773 /DNA_ORIENTATION=-
MVSAVNEKKGKSFLEMQPYFLAYGFGISLVSPTASVYQLLKLNPQVRMIIFPDGMKIAMKILPHQTVLKVLQMNASTPVKEQLNPWAAFAAVGILQGGVYGQANVFFSQQLKLGNKPSYSGVFRGWGYAGGRDMMSQGIPYVFSTKVRENILDQVWDTSSEPAGLGSQIKQWTAVIGTSIFATYISQGFHNCQITMHADQTVNHLGALRKAYAENGLSLLYKGGEARVGLLLVVNILNEAFLKKAWE